MTAQKNVYAKKTSFAAVMGVAKIQTNNHRLKKTTQENLLKNEINILEMLFGDIVDKLKEIIKKLKEKLRKRTPAIPEQIVVHQYKDYNNIA